jgi:quercetin dioxygenase-like cupin family protein
MRSDYVRAVKDQPVIEEDWGALVWLVGTKQLAGSEQTFGVVTIKPGRRNPLHSHPNCEELLYVMSGRCEHRIGEELHELAPGDVICIPRNTRHWARALGAEPLVAVISFSSPDRMFVRHEEEETAPP